MLTYQKYMLLEETYILGYFFSVGGVGGHKATPLLKARVSFSDPLLTVVRLCHLLLQNHIEINFR